MPKTLETQNDNTAETIHLYYIPVTSISAGMYIVKLDRPWSDTPFPQHGFQIQEEREIEALQRYCEIVLVDAALSRPDLNLSIRTSASLLESTQSPEDTLGKNFYFQDIQKFGGDSKQYNKSYTPQEKTLLDINQRAAAMPSSFTGKAVLKKGNHPTLRKDIFLNDNHRHQVQKILKDRRKRVLSRASMFGKFKSWLQSHAKIFFTSAGKETNNEANQSKKFLGENKLDHLRNLTGDTRIGSTQYTIKQNPLPEALPDLRLAYATLFHACRNAKNQIRLGKSFSIQKLKEHSQTFLEGTLLCSNGMHWIESISNQTVPAHSSEIAVALFLVDFGCCLGLPRDCLHELLLIGLVGDFGKTLLPRDILEYPGVLAPHEFALMQQHVSIGLTLLSRSGNILSAEALLGIEQHHERINGSGYPNGLQGSEIGLYGKMLGIVDTFVALTTARPYAMPLSIEDALTALQSWQEQFCPVLVELFIECVGAFPVGSLVELTSGELAVVVDIPRVNKIKLALVRTGDRANFPNKNRYERISRVKLPIRRTNQIDTPKSKCITRGLPRGAFGSYISDYYARGGKDKNLFFFADNY